MRLVEVFTAVPTLMLALLLVAIFGSSLTNIILAIGLVAWLDICRLLRAQLFSLRERDFVLAARIEARQSGRIAVRHLLPNSIAPVIVAVTIGIPVAIFAEAGLSFLGLGVNDPIPKLGADAGGAALRAGLLVTWASSPRWPSRSPCWASPFSATGSATRSTPP